MLSFHLVFSPKRPFLVLGYRDFLILVLRSTELVSPSMILPFNLQNWQASIIIGTLIDWKTSAYASGSRRNRNSHSRIACSGKDRLIWLSFSHFRLGIHRCRPRRWLIGALTFWVKRIGRLEFIGPVIFQRLALARFGSTG